MKAFPMFLKVAGRRIVIIGGGEQAAQKARLVLKTEAEMILVAPELDAELSSLVDEGQATRKDGHDSSLFDAAALVFVATGCKGADAAWHSRAKAAGALVNVVDYPDLCDAMTPSIVDRDPVIVAIGTEGTAPVLGRQIKSKIEQLLHPRLGVFAALAGRLRTEVARAIPAADRRAFWQWVFGGAPWTTFSTGDERRAAAMIKASITKDQPRHGIGRLTIVSDVTSPEHVTLGIVERLQAADVIYAEHGVPKAVMELARRDALRVKVSSKHQDLTKNSLRLAANKAAEPSNVVYLSTGQGTSEGLIKQDVMLEHLSCAPPQAERSNISPQILSA